MFMRSQFSSTNMPAGWVLGKGAGPKRPRAFPTGETSHSHSSATKDLSTGRQAGDHFSKENTTNESGGGDRKTKTPST